jgi:hypothetical protein
MWMFLVVVAFGAWNFWSMVLAFEDMLELKSKKKNSAAALDAFSGVKHLRLFRYNTSFYGVSPTSNVICTEVVEYIGGFYFRVSRPERIILMWSDAPFPGSQAIHLRTAYRPGLFEQEFRYLSTVAVINGCDYGITGYAMQILAKEFPRMMDENAAMDLHVRILPADP